MGNEKTIMIIDDDEDDNFFFCRAVKQLGHGWECVSARNGEQALEALLKAEKLPNYIFVDLNMPRMDGKEFLIELKKTPKLYKIPIIIYSTSDYEKDINLVHQLGAAYYLMKQSDIYKLPNNILKAIKVAEESIQ